jgi:predicted phosphoadenosine phosphosulfate sulfurtransferase
MAYGKANSHTGSRSDTKLNRLVKIDARTHRRSYEKAALIAAIKHEDNDDIVFPTKNTHVSDGWNWD